MLGYALDLALEHGERATAESLAAELRQRDAPMEVQLAAEAQFLGRTGSKDAEAKYQYISYVSRQSGYSDMSQAFAQQARAGLARIRHAQKWRGCSGLLIRQIEDPKLPVEVGDVVLRVPGQCVSGTASLQRAVRQAKKAPKIPIELWRNDELLQVALPGGKLPFFASPF